MHIVTALCLSAATLSEQMTSVPKLGARVRINE